MKHINMDDIKVSSKLDDVIKASVDKGYINIPYKNKINYRKILIAATLTAVFGISILGTISNKEVFASVKVFISHISNFLGLNNDLNEYRIDVNKSIYKNGLTLTLNEAILNKDEIIVSTLIKSDAILSGNDLLSVSGSAYINGEKLSNSVGGITKVIDNHTVESVDIYNLTSELPSGEVIIEIKNTGAYLNIANEKTTIDGPWNFEFKANGDKLNVNTKYININHFFTLDNNQKIILNKYVSNDVGQKIYYNIENKDINSPYQLILKGHDNLGNIVEFYQSYDELTNGLMKNQTEISKEASSIILTPYAIVYSNESGKTSTDYKKVGEEFTIKIK